MEIRATVLKVDEPDSQGRMVLREEVEKALPRFLKRINTGCAGEVTPSEPRVSIDLDRVCHLVDNVELVGDELVADIRIIPVGVGSLVEKAIAEIGIENVELTPRWVGVERNGVLRELEFITVDIKLPESDLTKTLQSMESLRTVIA